MGRLLVGIWRCSHGDVDVYLELFKFLIDEAQGSCDDGVRDLDSFQSDDAEFQFVQCAWCGVFESLDLEKEDRGCGVDAVG